MLTRLGRLAVRRRVLLLVATVLGMAVAGAVGGGVIERLSAGGFSDPESESARAARILDETFHAGSPNLLLLVTARQGTVDDPVVAERGAGLTRKLAAEPGIEQAFSYWTLGGPPSLRSGDGRQALVLARIGGSEDEVEERAAELSPKYSSEDGVVTVGVGGIAEVFRQVSTQVEADLRRAESITFPIVLILLVLVFGSVVAAGLPLGVGMVAVFGTLLVLRALTAVTDVSVFALNVTTAMGLGLGIDYSLFIVSRFREEMRAGRDTAGAVVRTVETAGRTVLFSAVTVAVSLAALAVFPLYFLRSFAYAGIAVVGLAAVGAVVSLPALLAVLGPRVDRLVLWRRAPKPVGEGAWHRIAVLVMRRPVPVAAAAVAFLAVLGAPFLGVRFGLPDDRVLPASASSRQVHEQIRANFTSDESAALSVVAIGTGPPGPGRDEAVSSLASTISAIPGVARVESATGAYAAGGAAAPPGPPSARFVAADATWMSVVPDGGGAAGGGESLVERIRAVDAPFPILVGGAAADLADSQAGLFSRIPVAAALIAVVTFVVLFLMTGSVLVPVKALVLNLLSLSATFGAMVWIFQEGNLSGLLGFTPTGTIDSTNPILIFCIAFGLSMDYEVFLLSRIKEEWDRTGDNVASVAVGLERTGRIVTAAAAILAVVFVAFATSEITLMKLAGIGLALAVVMDATVVRAALVPAFMRLAGRANWWAPGPLRTLHAMVGMREVEGTPVIPTATEVGSEDVRLAADEWWRSRNGAPGQADLRDEVPGGQGW